MLPWLLLTKIDILIALIFASVEASAVRPHWLRPLRPRMWGGGGGQRAFTERCAVCCCDSSERENSFSNFRGVDIASVNHK
jgi:hypothetical protein